MDNLNVFKLVEHVVDFIIVLLPGWFNSLLHQCHLVRASFRFLKGTEKKKLPNIQGLHS